MEFNRKYIGCFGRLPRRTTTTGVVIHHTATASPAATRRALKSKGCSTHFEIDRDGTVYQYAELDRRCSHCGSSNFQFVGVDITHPKDGEWTKEQLQSADELFEYLSVKLGIPRVCYAQLPPGFYYHRAIGETVCPQNFPEEVVTGKGM